MAHVCVEEKRRECFREVVTTSRLHAIQELDTNTPLCLCSTIHSCSIRFKHYLPGTDLVS